jgi:TonB family protein
VHFALNAKPLIVLTQDEQLLAVLREVTDPVHEVRALAAELDLSGALLAQHAGVAVLDCAALVTPIATLTARLHTQFPELVLIVAGEASAQGMLAAQITDGSVHRFLHKPLSEQRVRLFVESAWRRQAQGATPASTAPPPRSAAARTLRIAAVLTALAVVAAPLAWIALRSAQLSPGVAPAVAPGAVPARRSGVDAAPGREAAIELLLAQAETQLAAAQLDAAQRLTEEARALAPDHPRVAFVAAQINAQRERAVLGKAQRAAAGGNVAGALAVLDDAAQGGHPSALVTEARQQLVQQQVDARVSDYLQRAGAAMRRGALIDPVEDNARFYLESARALAPQDERVSEAMQGLIARLEREARQALAAGNPDQVDLWATAAADAGAAPERIAALRADAQQLRGAARADALAQLAASFNQRLEQGHIVEPAGDSAQFYLTQLTQADAVSPAAQLARQAYATRALDEGRNTLTAQDFPGTQRWIGEARATGAAAAQLAALEADLGTAEHNAQQASSYATEGTLTRTRYVPPSFPDAARQHGIGGWVDLQFLVGVDGAVSDVAVVGAQPAGIFEQAAIDAVRHWRYQPVARDGRTVSQRARVRVRFQVAQ